MKALSIVIERERERERRERAEDSTHFMLPNTDRMDAELEELSDSDESTELPKLDLTVPLQGTRVVGSFCRAATTVVGRVSAAV